MRKFILTLIKLYQATISKVIPSSCRFSPSCSQYAYEAIAAYGIFKGIWLGMKRLARCNPLHEGGYDPIPGKS